MDFPCVSPENTQIFDDGVFKVTFEAWLLQGGEVGAQFSGSQFKKQNLICGNSVPTDHDTFAFLLWLK